MSDFSRSNALLLLLFLFAAGFLITGTAQGQIREPELMDYDAPRTPLDEGVRRGIGFNVVINNFGFGLGAEYRRVLAPYMEGTLTLRMAGLRDASEQTFTDFFFGQQIIPNKYQRGFSFPLFLGLRHRIFARSVEDSFRFFLSGSAGPVMAFTYPYFNDHNGNGFREGEQFAAGFNYFEPVNDIFTGLGQGEWHLGMGGELMLNLDIGRNFANLTSIQFGYLFYWFRDGIELMYPNQPDLSQQPFTQEQVINGTYPMIPFFKPQKYFGTPQVSFVFGRMW